MTWQLHKHSTNISTYMLNANPTNKFSPDIPDYFALAGFTPANVPIVQGGLLFLKKDDADQISVQFWQDKIEVRRGFNFQLTHSHKGFDGQDIPQMMWLMYFMKAIDLNEVKRSALAERVAFLEPVSIAV